MRNIFSITSLFCVGVIFSPVDAHALNLISQNIIGGSVDLYEHSVVGHGSRIINATIRVNSSLMLNNSGVINAPVNICSDCVLYFQNNGRFSGSFNFDAGAKLVQVISHPDEYGNLATDRIDGIMIHNADRISMTDIEKLGKGDLVFSNSSIIMDTSDLSFISSLDLQGDVLVYVDNDFSVSDSPLLENVSGDGTLHIVSNISDDLMGFKTYIVKDKLYVKWERETDYAKVFRDNTGRFLNTLRSSHADDRLLSALDNAPNMSALRDVMDKSVRLNPVKLMTVPRLLDRVETVSSTKDGISFGPFSLIGDGFGTYGISAGFNTNVSGRLNIGVAGYMNVGDYSDDINDYDFVSYGANIRARYDGGNGYFIRGIFGASHSRFGIGPVFDGAEIVNDPSGIGIYGTADVGVSITTADAFKVSPYIGLGADYASVAHDTDTNIMPRIGIDMYYEYKVFDIIYEIDMRAYAMRDDYFGAGATFGIKFPWDFMGINAGADIMNTEFGTAYKISVGTRMWF